MLTLALEYFLNKGVITKSEFVKLTAEMRWKSFTVAYVEREGILRSIQEALGKALEGKTGVVDFVDNIDQLFDNLGVSKLNPYHLDTVFITNLATGYSTGRERIMDQLEIDEFPLRQVTAVGDARTREKHMALDGFTAAADDLVWSWLKTPFSYRCRCKITPVHKDEGLTASDYIPDVRGKKGFEFLR
jgi:SPP1 gp7 family putative phage head morphogenesis protein